MAYPITYLYLASFVAVTIVFAFVVAATPRQDAKRSLVVAGYLVAGWALADGLSSLATTAEQMQVLSWIFSPVWAPIPFFLLRAALLSAGHRRLARSTGFWIGGLLPAAGCVGLVLSGWLHHEFVPAGVRGPYFQTHATSWFWFVGAYYASYGAVAAWVLLAAARRRGEESLRITGGLLLFGLSPVVVVGVLVNGGLSSLGIDPPYLGSVLASAFAVSGALWLRRQVFFAPLESVARERDEARDFLSQREQVLEALPGGVLIVEASSGLVLYRNERARALLGRDELERLPEEIGSVLGAGDDLGDDPQVEMTLGPLTRVLSVHARPIEYGGEERLLVGLRDITRQTDAERQLQEQRDQLRHAEKMEAIGRLSAGVAHDFNNLLTAVAANAEILLEELGRDHRLTGEVGDILRAVRYGQGLTRQLLAFSRKQAARPEVLDVHRVLDTEARMLRRLLGSDVELVVEPDHRPCPIRIDPVQLEQVLVTLATNARDAMPGGGRLTFRVRRCDEGARAAGKGGGAVRIEVSDTGVGMGPDVIVRIFEPFFSTKGKHGTGLGLATVYGIVTQAGGTISVRSEPSQGAVFRMEFPVAAEGLAAGGDAAEADAIAPTVRTVLLVDDDPAMLRSVQGVLAAAGLTVLTATSGQEALRLFEKNPRRIDLLLTDVVMPEMSGLDLALELLSVTPGLPVMLLTGHRSQAAGELGDDALVVGKPFDPPALVAMVEQLLADRAGAGRATEDQPV
ncbi:MAG: response regulator [Deltaproteobacteria bacterium]|nr:response regulator [Deltaproteobacteria bacterium]MBW2530114.1 response regulator [Deltaproteobacteria bacterium]